MGKSVQRNAHNRTKQWILVLAHAYIGKVHLNFQYIGEGHFSYTPKPKRNQTKKKKIECLKTL